MMEDLCLQDETINGEVLDPLAISPEKKATKDVRVTLRLKGSTRDKYIAEANRQNKSASHVMRKALERGESCIDD